MILTTISNISNITKSIASIGDALSAFASTVAPIITKVITILAPTATTLGNFASTLLQNFGILKAGENPEDIGDRALQAAEKGITIDQYDDIEDYLDALRGFNLDPDESANRSLAEKLVAGLGVFTVVIENKYSAQPGSLNYLWLLPLANSTYFTPERMQGIIKTSNLTIDILNYLEKRLSAGDSSRFEDALLVNGDNKEKHYAALDKARDQWDQLGQQIEHPENRARA